MSRQAPARTCLQPPLPLLSQHCPAAAPAPRRADHQSASADRCSSSSATSAGWPVGFRRARRETDNWSMRPVLASTAASAPSPAAPTTSTPPASCACGSHQPAVSSSSGRTTARQQCTRRRMRLWQCKNRRHIQRQRRVSIGWCRTSRCCSIVWTQPQRVRAKRPACRLHCCGWSCAYAARTGRRVQ